MRKWMSLRIWEKNLQADFFSNSLTAPKLKEGLMQLSADRIWQIILHDFKFFSSIYMEGSKKNNAC